MSRRTRHLMSRARNVTATLPLPHARAKPLPLLCPGNTHIFHFVDRVQLGLPGEGGPGAYPLVSYVQCTRCVACVEFLGACDPIEGKTLLESAWFLFPDGRGYPLEMPANRTILTAHG